MTSHHPTPTYLRRTVLRTGAAATALAIGAGTAVAAPGKPAFTDQIYGDGETWGTKGATTLPAPTDDNAQSFDPLVFIARDATSPPVQLPVSEAAPGNPAYNGGRWISMTATIEDMSHDFGTSPLTSYSEVLTAISNDLLNPLVPGAPVIGGSKLRPDYFECPLLPTKDA